MTTSTSTRRTDTHAPASETFDPQAYEFIFYVDLHIDFGNRRAMTEFLAPMFAGSFTKGPHWGHSQCGHCGAHLRYAAVAVHIETREIILIGEQCLENRFGLTQPEFQAMRKAAALNSERLKKIDRIARMIENDPDLVWVSYVPNIAAFSWSEFMMDMHRALMVNGYMSPAQRYSAVKTVRRLTEKFWNDEAARIARESESAGNVEAHIGAIKDKLSLTGEVTQVFRGDPYAYYGPIPYTYVVRTVDGTVKFTTTSATFIDDNGDSRFKRGDEITFTGTVKQHSMYRGQPQTTLTRCKAL